MFANTVTASFEFALNPYDPIVVNLNVAPTLPAEPQAMAALVGDGWHAVSELLARLQLEPGFPLEYRYVARKLLAVTLLDGHLKMQRFF